VNLLARMAIFGALAAVAASAGADTRSSDQARSVPLGVYVGAGCGGVQRLEGVRNWLGRDPDQVIEFISWDVLSKGKTWGVQCWQKAGRKHVVYSLPMLPEDKSATLADGAAGKFDDLFKTYAGKLVKHGFSDSVIRIGWEFNADWYPWAAKHDPQAWIAYWRRIVTTMRSVPGANFKFDWCAAGGWSAFQADNAYPGDEYVDIIGLDYYNNLGQNRQVSPQERWDIRKKAPHGLDWHRRFATAHGKPMSYPEWGTGKGREANGGDDDPYFIEQMAAWIASNNVAYHNYWDFAAPIYDAKLSDGRRPAAGAAFVRAFGKAADRGERKDLREAAQDKPGTAGRLRSS
jgi:hypothetical protein